MSDPVAQAVAQANNAAKQAVVQANNAIEAANQASAAAEAIVNNPPPLPEAVPAELAEAVAPPQDPRVEHVFANAIKISKFALLALLLIMSFINGHKEYIAEKPRKFMWDNFAVGLTSAIGISIIAAMRGRSDLIPNLAFIAFFLFFTYNVFRELSGLNALSDHEKLSQGEAEQARKLKKPMAIIFAIGFLLLSGLAFKARVAHPEGFGALAKEAAIFAICTVIGELVVGANHDEKQSLIAMAGLVNFIMFFAGHILLQYGGFYNHVFGAPGPVHDPIDEALHEE